MGLSAASAVEELSREQKLSWFRNGFRASLRGTVGEVLVAKGIDRALCIVIGLVRKSS
jgi:hypothetical protein